jgi:hypothetical protein
MNFLSGFTDDGSEIFFRADTQDLQLIQEFEVFSNPKTLVTEVQRGSQMRCFVSINKEDFYEIDGTATKGVSILKINSRDETRTKPVHARRIKISYRDSSRQRCRISQTAITYIPTTLEEPSE